MISQINNKYKSLWKLLHVHWRKVFIKKGKKKKKELQQQQQQKSPLPSPLPLSPPPPKDFCVWKIHLFHSKLKTQLQL